MKNRIIMFGTLLLLVGCNDDYVAKGEIARTDEVRNKYFLKYPLTKAQKLIGTRIERNELCRAYSLSFDEWQSFIEIYNEESDRLQDLLVKVKNTDAVKVFNIYGHKFDVNKALRPKILSKKLTYGTKDYKLAEAKKKSLYEMNCKSYLSELVIAKRAKENAIIKELDE